MISAVSIVVGIIFLIGTIIDLKTKKVPSFLFTSLILISLFIAGISQGLEAGYMHILFGIIAGVFGYLLWEMYFIGGVADIKALIFMGLLCSDLASLILMIVFVAIFGTLYQAIFKFISYKRGKLEGENIFKAIMFAKNEEPFLLLLFLIYIFLFAIGGLI